MPEMVVVLETVGGVEDFRRAAERAELEWMGEFEVEDTSPDDDFFDEDRRDRDLPRRLYLTFANQAAIQRLLSLWQAWQSGGRASLPRGFKKWDELLERLHDVRTWGPSDRLAETGALEDWRERVSRGDELIRFQVELWYRRDEGARALARDRMVALLRAEGGTLLAECAIAEIHYHGILADLPSAAIQRVLQAPTTAVVRADQVMFFRPCAQGAVRPVSDQDGEPSSSRERNLPSGDPVVALLDGLPVENHTLLEGRIVVDDPDGLSATYPVQVREHGTAMASLIVHGDLAEEGRALPTPLYVHPVMVPVEFDGNRWEELPNDQLTVDAIHQAVRRILDPDAGGAAQTVRVVNLSLGDRYYPFNRLLSPWARLLDWLSGKYGVVFVVSSGNYTQDVELPVRPEEARQFSAPDLQVSVLDAAARGSRHRAILAPGEAVNVLTIGASNADASRVQPAGDIRELVCESEVPAPYSRIGLGYRRAIKPDLLAPGGRGWYREAPSSNGVARFTQVVGRLGAGLEHACPGQGATATNRTGRSAATSNAAAICSRSLAFAYEALRPLLSGPSGDRLLHGHEALLLRALAVHTADWGGARNCLDPILSALVDPRRVRDHMSRFLGYGVLRPERMEGCTEQRATVLGLSALSDGRGHQYRLPVPTSLGGYVGAKRLTATLAWFTPINARHRLYKRADLWFELPDLELPLSRAQCDWQGVKRGTIQHEILVGTRAGAVGDDTDIKLNVNCRAYAGALEQPVPYVLICSLEVGEGVHLPVYQEIRERLQVRVRATPPAPISPSE